MNVKNLKQGYTQSHIIILVLFIILVSAGIFSLALGRYHIPIGNVAHILLASMVPDTMHNNLSWQETEWAVVLIVRLPRVLVTILCGMGLSLSGAALQGLFRNPLVGPQIIGVSSGASFGGALAILLSLSSFSILSFAFAFGLGSLVLVFALSRLAGRGGILSLVLAGIIISSLCSALVGLIQYLSDSELILPRIVFWLLGSFGGITWQKVLVVSIPIILAGAFLLLLRWRINLLSLGDTDASILGIRVGVLRWIVLSLVSLIVAAQVSVSGGVGWVGLVIPHFARMLVGPDHRKLLPASALMGGAYLLLIDDIARCLTSQEIPIGILTAIVGTPVFAFVFWKTQARGWSRD